MNRVVMHERELLKTMRERLCPDVLSYIREFLPETVTYRWEHPIYRKIYKMKKDLIRLKHEEKRLIHTIVDTLDNCFDPGMLRHLSDVEEERRRITTMVNYKRNAIVELNEEFLRSRKIR